jgi:hypothetical protein
MLSPHQWKLVSGDHPLIADARLEVLSSSSCSDNHVKTVRARAFLRRGEP